MVPLPDRSRTRVLIALSRRTLGGALTAFVAVTLTFFALRAALGDPINSLLSQGLATAEQADALRRSLGLDQPLVYQYLNFLGGIVRGQFGRSLYTSQPVTQIILQQLPATAALATGGLFSGVVLGCFLGVAAAWDAPGPMGRSASTISGILTSIPVAFIGILALLIAGRIGEYFIRSSSLQGYPGLILPAMVLGMTTAGPIGKVIETSLVESLNSAYIQAALARGYRKNLRLLWHALRPALPPVISLSALEAAYLFSGTVITETVFSRPGLGRLLLRSILEGDFPVAQGLVVLAAVLYSISHLAADIFAMLIDPRLRSTQ